jgi:hypothetical protein
MNQINPQINKENSYLFHHIIKRRFHSVSLHTTRFIETQASVAGPVGATTSIFNSILLQSTFYQVHLISYYYRGGAVFGKFPHVEVLDLFVACIHAIK